MADEGCLVTVFADEGDVGAESEGLLEGLFFVGREGEPFLGGHPDLVDADVGAPVGGGLGEVDGGGDEGGVGGLEGAPVFGVEGVGEGEEGGVGGTGVVAGLGELHHGGVDVRAGPGKLSAPSVVEVVGL